MKHEDAITYLVWALPGEVARLTTALSLDIRSTTGGSTRLGAVEEVVAFTTIVAGDDGNISERIVNEM